MSKNAQQCPNCEGTGKINDTRCLFCSGFGLVDDLVVKRYELIQLAIAAGPNPVVSINRKDLEDLSEYQ